VSVRPVLRMGHPQLMSPSSPVEDFSDPQLSQVIEDMYDTMRAEGGVGIAAPQIAYFKRILMFGFEHSERYPDMQSVPFSIFINPVIQVIDSTLEEGWEGCLSVPGLRGLVPRYKKISYQAFDINGKIFKGEAEGFHARVIQHELDHLDGILYPSRIQNFQKFGFEQELSLPNVPTA